MAGDPIEASGIKASGNLVIPCTRNRHGEPFCFVRDVVAKTPAQSNAIARRECLSEFGVMPAQSCCAVTTMIAARLTLLDVQWVSDGLFMLRV